MIYLTVSTNRCLRFDGVKGEGKSVFGDEEEKEKKKKKELGLYFVYNKIYVYEKRFLSLRVRIMSIVFHTAQYIISHAQIPIR